MKNLILTATFLVAGASSMLGQGAIDNFSNAPWEAWPEMAQVPPPAEPLDRFVYKDFVGGAKVDDPTWSAQLVQFNNGQWEKLGAPENFFGPGLEGIFASDGAVRVATVSTVAIEIYDGGNNLLVRSPSFNYTRGASSPPSPTDALLVNLRAFAVPEPSTIALGVLGLGALLLFRRRK